MKKQLFIAPAYLMCPECGSAVPGNVTNQELGEVRLSHPYHINCSLSGMRATINLTQTAEIEFYAPLEL